ncbi:hypothetical protein PV11_02069 [Exophiala sideris]|uniref:Putative gamma-glutamylcyclotransferase n=1 Tax=Exophiala sideris TaxID=1016849 RepID=A0A0D1ZHZ6_9EURO|nr:hypothetical protein PV11_02069 [Exophiala sideris]
MGDHTAFFYGTLMAPGVLHRVIYGTHDPEPWQKNSLTVRPAMLQSYRRHRVRNADYPAIIPHAESCVRGSVVTCLTEGDLYRLDIFEGYQYSRQKVKVQVLKDVGLDQAAEDKTEVVEEVEAESYIWEDGEDTLEPIEWDFEEFKRDKMKAWAGMAEYGDTAEMDEGFADVDRAVAEQEKSGHDPMGGRGTNGHIGQQLKEAAV